MGARPRGLGQVPRRGAGRPGLHGLRARGRALPDGPAFKVSEDVAVFCRGTCTLLNELSHGLFSE